MVWRCSMSAPQRSRIEGIHCAMEMERLARGVALVVIEGTDVGELGDAPFRVLDPWLTESEHFELFVDARRARGPSVDVSHDWALWLNKHRTTLLHVSFLTGSRLVELSAGFVKSFADLGEQMRLFHDASLFAGALGNAEANAKARELRGRVL